MPDYEIIQLAEGWSGTDLTVEKVLDIVDQSLTKPNVVLTARRIVQYVPERDRDAEIAAVSAFVREKMRYTNEGVETLTAPWIMLKEIRERGNFPGDCDESVILWLSLLKSLGFKTRIDVISQRADKRANHIYGEVLSPTRGWITDDTIVKNKPLGWAPHAEVGVTRRKVYGDLLAMSGLSGGDTMLGLTLEERAAKRESRKARRMAMRASREARRLARRAALQSRTAKMLPPGQIAGVRRVRSDKFAKPKQMWSQQVATPAIAWKHWRGMDLARDEHGTVEGIIPNLRSITESLKAGASKLISKAKSYIPGYGDGGAPAPAPEAPMSAGLPILPILIVAGVGLFLISSKRG
jgi:hypothetical protein